MAVRAAWSVWLRRLAGILMIVTPLAAHAQTPKRVALVVGNGGYRSVDRLANPANDARLMAKTLRDSGFTLIGDGPQIDLDKPRFDRAVQAFGRALAGADVALFYYSGHGMQVAGENWLVPVDANPTSAHDLDFQMVDASLVLRQMEGAGTKLNLLILDACRNNPFGGGVVRGAAGGLAEMHAPEGTLISYATQPGNVAVDGAGSNSPYTAALAAAMHRPGLDVFQVFNQVGLSVKQETAGQQQPWLASSPISGSFYFFAGPVTVNAGGGADADTVFWQSIANSRDPADFQAYLRRFPAGVFADLARRRLATPAAAAIPLSAGGRFDGIWAATVVCQGAEGGVSGYVQAYAGRISNGVLHAEFGNAARPPWAVMEGAIQPDGSALLDVRGLTGDPAYTLTHDARGTPFSYHLNSQFADGQGRGTRVERRACTASFTRQ